MFSSSMDQSPQIEELLLAAARKDRSAFRELFEISGPKLFGVCLRICREKPLAEDAAQDAFVEIWRKAGDFDPARGNANAWMSVIARNRAIDLVRRRGRSPSWGGGSKGGEDEDDRIAALPDLSKAADGGAETIALGECLARLETAQREMVMLAYCEGYSREELSARFDAPVNTVKTWLRRGLATLKNCLDE